MKITATFDSLEEFQAFINGGKKPLTAEELNKTAQKTADIINAAEAKEEAEKAEKKKAKKAEPKAETIADPEEIVAEAEAKAKKDDVDYDALRVECRKVLAALNKATGTNTASEMIKAHGAKKLSEVEDMFLPALLEEAKEALADAE